MRLNVSNQVLAMGLLVEGNWVDRWYKKDEEGRFVRPDTQFRHWVRRDGSTPHQPEAGRYHLYVAWACPWAHRTLLARTLCGLKDAVSMTIVQPRMGDHGWAIAGSERPYDDPLHGADYLHQVYTAARSDYTGRVTVPTLWDKQEKTIVSNESREILRMFDVEFRDVGDGGLDLYPKHLQSKIEQTIDAIYQPINNGVYRAGFADTQQAYEEAVYELFDALGHWNEVLESQRYLCGDQLTEADICMFTTLVRFDPVYAYHFRCNLKRLDDFESLHGYLREIYQMPGVAETFHLEQTKEHYFWSHEHINPKRIVPVGPPWLLDAPHGRGHLLSRAESGK